MAKILVVDDEFGIGDLLRDLLGDEGHDVSLAINGRQGLQCIARDRPDLVFLDYMMPVLDGAEVMKSMAATPAMADIPVIVMSSLPEASIAERTNGYAAYVRKPFRIATIIDLTARVLANKEGPCAT